MITLGHQSYAGGIDERFDPVIVVGNYTSLGAGLIIYGTCQHPQTVSTYPFTDKLWCDESVYPKSFSRGTIQIGSDVWIGEDVTILDGVTIHDGAIIGVGSVVTRDIPAFAVAVGNPATVLRYRFSIPQRVALQKIAWWNWGEAQVKEELPYMKDIKLFIERNK